MGERDKDNFALLMILMMLIVLYKRKEKRFVVSFF